MTEEGFDVGEGGEVEEFDGAVEGGGVELLSAEAEREGLWRKRRSVVKERGGRKK
jgi:hypothetical protein